MVGRGRALLALLTGRAEESYEDFVLRTTVGGSLPPPVSNGTAETPCSARLNATLAFAKRVPKRAENYGDPAWPLQPCTDMCRFRRGDPVSRTALAPLLGLVLLGADGFEPARFSRGPMPPPLQQTVGWSEVFLEVSVSAAGRVDGIEALRASEPLAQILRAVVEQWYFEPASEDGDTIKGQVLVAAVYRPATLFDTPSVGVPARDIAQASERIPYPLFTPPPPYPPTALGNGIVLVEVLVGSKGDVRAATVVGKSGTAFDVSAIRSATRWRFRPARRDRAPVPVYAYLVFGFRQPVVFGKPPR